MRASGVTIAGTWEDVMAELHELTATEAGALLESGEITSEEYQDIKGSLSYEK